MNDLYDILIPVFGDVSAMMLALLVFLAAAVLAFGLMATVHARGLVKRRAGGINKNYGDDHLSRSADRHTAQRAPPGLPRFHGPPGGVRRFRAEHGGGAGTRRTRAWRYLSVAVRQHPHDQPGNPRRPHHDGGARTFRRPAWARRGARVRDPDPAVRRARFEHHRGAARLFRRHAPQ